MSVTAKKDFIKAFPAPDWLARRERGTFNSGCRELDILTGGIPRSAIVEICGQSSSGRTALAYSILGNLLSSGHVCAYIDGTNSFDPHSAFQTELPTERLLWTRCAGSLKKTLLAADAVLRAGGFAVTILDLADFSIEEISGIPLSYWFRFQRTIEKQPSSIIVLSKVPVTKTTAALVVNCHTPETGWRGRNFPVLSEIKSEIYINRPAPRRSTSVLLKSYFWLEQGNVCRHPFSRR